MFAVTKKIVNVEIVDILFDKTFEWSTKQNFTMNFFQTFNPDSI